MLLYLKPLNCHFTVSHYFQFSCLPYFHFPLLRDLLHVPNLQKKVFFSDYFMMILFEPKQASWQLCVCLEHNSKDLGQPDLKLQLSFCAFVCS